MFSPYRCLLLLFTLMCFAKGQGPTIAQLFTVDSSCNVQDMQTVLNNARSLLAAAQTGITNLLQTKTFASSTTRNYMRNAKNSFGTSYYPFYATGGLSTPDAATLSTVSNTFTMIQDLLAGKVVNGQQLDSDLAFLACNDNGYVLTDQAGDINPEDEGFTTEDIYNEDALWYYPGSVNPTGTENRVVAARIDDNGAVDTARLCRPGLDWAWTGYSGGGPTATDDPLIQVIFCSLAFQQLKPSIGGSPGKSAQIAAWQSLAGAFIHEMMHVISILYLDRVFYSPSGVKTLSYGPAAIYAIANKVGESSGHSWTAQQGSVVTTNLPDAYRLFAEECYYSGTAWSINQQ